jgi:hypothetical protein
MSESALIKRLLLEAPESRRLFRINAGMAWSGAARRISVPETVKVYPGDVVIRAARPFHGAMKGWPDLCGWETVEVTKDMVGKKLAVFVALEAKTEKVPVTKEQANFLRQVESAGGVAEIIRE